jgi:excisionase family DNA binding protein
LSGRKKIVAKLYSADEVAGLLGIQPDTLYRYARRGEIRGVKIGKLWRFAEADVEEFVQGRRQAVASPQPRSRLLPDLLHDAARTAPDAGVVCGATRTSYGEIDVLSDRLAAALVTRGVQPGDRVLVALPNSVEFVTASFAVWKARAILVPEYAAVHIQALHELIAEARPTALVVDNALAEHLAETPDGASSLPAIFVKDRTFTLAGVPGLEVEALNAVLESSQPLEALPLAGAAVDDVVSITYTSGATGRPKGVMHSHESWLAGAAFTRAYHKLTPRDSIVVPLPLHHAYAFRQMLAYALAGGTLILAPDVYQGLKALREQRPTSMLLVPAACTSLLDRFEDELRQADDVLRYVEIGSSALPPERLEHLRRLLPTTEVHLAYGLTEARVAFLKRGPDGLLNRIATLDPGLEIDVVDGAGRPVGEGEVGEIRIRGTGMMKGYWGDSEHEQERLRRHGLHTGDAGRLHEEGEVEVIGRLEDALEIGGREVHPLEVETALNRHPLVVEAAVVSEPDAHGHQELHAFVVPRKGVVLNDAQLSAHCRRHVEGYKVPSRFYFCSSLPKSPIGKVLRQALVKGHVG